MTLEEIIREMVKNGMSTEDIAKKTQDTLNSIEKVEKEKKEKEKAIEEDRKNHLRVLERSLKEDIEKGRHVLDDVGILAALAMVHDYPNWTVDDINAFITSVNKNVKMQAEFVALDMDKSLEKACSVIEDMFKSKETKQEKKKKKCGDEWDSLNKACYNWFLDMLGM